MKTNHGAIAASSEAELGSLWSHIGSSWRRGISPWSLAIHSVDQKTRGAIEAHQGVMETRLGTMETYSGVLRALHTANEGLVRIQYKSLVPIYVFPEMKLHGLVIFPKQNYNVLSPNIHIYIFPGWVCLFSCSQIGRPILGIYISHTDTRM